MRKLPPPTTLRRGIPAAMASGSLNYLASHPTMTLPDGTNPDSVMDIYQSYIWDESIRLAPSFKSAVNTAKGIVHHVDALTKLIIEQLWPREFFISEMLISELLFDELRSADPILEVFKRLKKSEAKRRGVLVFPLKSFGIIGAGILRTVGASVEVVQPAQSYALSPQTNQLQRTKEFLDRALPQLGVDSVVGYSDLEHVRKSRGADWLERNPLALIGINSASGYFFENEFLQLGRLRTVGAILVMMATLQSPNRRGVLTSSRSINNWQTLDTGHYLMLTSGKRRRADVQTIPVRSRREVLELTDLDVELDLAFWNRRAARMNSIVQAVETAYQGYLEFQLKSGKRSDPRGSVYAKWLESLAYFRRSVHQDGSWQSIVGLATAFEMLLTDKYAAGVALLLKARARELLRGIPGTRKYQDAIEAVYYARNEAVHAGTVRTVDMDVAREAYVHVFVSLMSRVAAIPLDGQGAILALTGVSLPTRTDDTRVGP